MAMLVLTPIGSTAATYYFRGQGAGRWMGGAIGLLGLEREVTYPDLVRVLRGCHPGSGAFLPASKPRRRRAGWDLTLAAPKSVSLLAASATTGGEAIKVAHQATVGEVVEDLEQRLTSVRSGVVAACFDHSFNGSGEPHLHSHLLVCNLGCDERGAWSALDRSWWPRRRALGAVYQLGLRYHLRAAGLELDWRLHADGLGDLAGVPRAAVRSTSGRSRAASLDRAAVQVDGGGGRTFGIRSGATIQTRPSEVSEPWPRRVRAAGFGPAAADALLAAGGLETNQAGAGPNLERTVTGWLATRRSSFRQEDVLVALAACAPGGLPAREAERWAERFCQAAIPVDTRLVETGSVEIGPARSRRWTTVSALAADRRLIKLVEQRRSRVPSATERPVGPVQQLLDGPGSVHILGAPPGWTNLLAQAAVLERAASAWRRSGARVEVATSSGPAEIRWQTLTGIGPHRPGPAPDVLIIDHADRRSTAELLGLLAGLKPGGQAVLVEGGTSPRLSWRHSDGLAWLGERQGRLDPGPTPGWIEHIGTHRVEGLAAYANAAQAAGALLGRWASGSGPATTALVGLGYPEVDGLNRAARAVLARRGELSGPELLCGGRLFQAGERVIALRRLSEQLPRGSLLEVVAVDPRQSTLTVSREGTRVNLDRQAASHLGYRYAVTPPLATRLTVGLLVLGPPSALGSHRDRVLAAAVAGPAPEPALERVANRRERTGRAIESGGLGKG